MVDYSCPACLSVHHNQQLAVQPAVAMPVYGDWHQLCRMPHHSVHVCVLCVYTLALCMPSLCQDSGVGL